jgi:MFS family permease
MTRKLVTMPVSSYVGSSFSEDFGSDMPVVYQISLYFVGEAATVLQWSRLSDSIGRKPILLGGILGLMIATVLFGLSRSFWTLASR